jgi:hypothetical protein
MDSASGASTRASFFDVGNDGFTHTMQLQSKSDSAHWKLSRAIACGLIAQSWASGLQEALNGTV